MVDFTGSTCEVYGNCNAPRAVTLSALIYCLRCMVRHDVPLNQVSNTKQNFILPFFRFLEEFCLLYELLYCLKVFTHLSKEFACSVETIYYIQ